MIDDGLEAIDITPDPLLLAAEKRPPWLSRFWTGCRPVFAFPVRAFTSIWANGTILLCGALTIIVGATFFLTILALIVAALFIGLLAIVLFGMSFGFVRIGDWISGTKTLAFLPKVLRDAADKVNVSEDIGNIRARANARRNRGG